MIETIFDQEKGNSTFQSEIVKISLKKLFPRLSLDSKEFVNHLQTRLPFFSWQWNDKYLSLHFVCRHRLHIGKFFYEMIHRWLVPGKRLDASFFISVDFKFKEEPNLLFTLAEMTVGLEDYLNILDIEHNLKIIETEIRLGMVSVYHASRLLEMNLLTIQEKNGILQEKITRLIQRNPEEIDYDIFGELQHFMLMSKEEFRLSRNSHHLSRVIAVFYLFRKSIERDRSQQPQKRHIRLKMSSINLELPWGKKKVLALCVGLNFLRPSEVFEERHLLRALKNSLPQIKPVSDSFFVNEGTHSDIYILYIEIEKINGLDFTREEIFYLKKNLPEEIKRSVEVPLNSVFMPRNEEEIIRHIITLSGQLRFVKDLPQVILVFDEQKEGDIYFTIILVRILFPQTDSIQNLFNKNRSFLTYFPDRIKRVGILRKKYPKEATVFRVKLPCLLFLRDDHSVDLFKARQAIIQELQRLLGGVRDYMGGMIAKQIELLESLQKLLGDSHRSDSRLLDGFFHSLYPIEARSVISSYHLGNLFLLWKEILENRDPLFLIKEDDFALYMIGLETSLKDLDLTEFPEMQVIVTRPEYEERFLGYIFFSQDKNERKKFLEKVRLEDLSHQISYLS